LTSGALRQIASVSPSRRGPSEPRSFFPVLCHAIPVLLLLPLLLPYDIDAQSQPEEYRVKAALVFHFAQLVDWPPSAFPTDSSPLNICTIGQDPFHGDLETTLQGKSVGARAVHIRHPKEVQDLVGCHIVFIGANENKRLPQVLAELGKSPVMTFGESDGFLEQGGMVCFMLEDGKIRFDINLDPAEQAGVKVGSRLLLLAKTVTGKHKQE
jgi:hypothetical protein